MFDLAKPRAAGGLQSLFLNRQDAKVGKARAHFFILQAIFLAIWGLLALTAGLPGRFYNCGFAHLSWGLPTIRLYETCGFCHLLFGLSTEKDLAQWCRKK